MIKPIHPKTRAQTFPALSTGCMRLPISASRVRVASTNDAGDLPVHVAYLCSLVLLNLPSQMCYFHFMIVCCRYSNFLTRWVQQNSFHKVKFQIHSHLVPHDQAICLYQSPKTCWSCFSKGILFLDVDINL